MLVAHTNSPPSAITPHWKWIEILYKLHSYYEFVESKRSRFGIFDIHTQQQQHWTTIIIENEFICSQFSLSMALVADETEWLNENKIL